MTDMNARTATLEVPETHFAPTGPIHFLKAARTVWWRELILFTKSGPRLVIAFVQPMLFLFVLGTGLSSITGGALDSNEGEPGPIYLQGDHTAVEFRRIVLVPATVSR